MSGTTESRVPAGSARQETPPAPKTDERRVRVVEERGYLEVLVRQRAVLRAPVPVVVAPRELVDLLLVLAAVLAMRDFLVVVERLRGFHSLKGSRAGVRFRELS